MTEPVASRGLLRFVSRTGMLGSGAVVFAATMLVNVAAFVFHAIASRWLGVSDYGALYALISLYTLAATPAQLFGPVIAKFAAEFRALHDDAHMRGLATFIARIFGLIGFVCVVLAFAFAKPLAAFLHVATWEIPVVGVMIAAGSLVSVFRGLSQGAHEFNNYALSVSAEAFGRVGFLVLFGLGGLTVLGGVLGFLGGLVLGLMVVVYPPFVRLRRTRPAHIHLDWRRIWLTTMGAASITTALAVIGFGDVVVVKHFFNGPDAGLYSAASLGGKMLFFVIAFVPTVLLPLAADRHVRGQRTRSTLAASLAFIAFVGVFGVVAYRYFGLYLLRLLVGGAFDSALPLLVGYSAAMAFLGMTNALASYGIATNRIGFAVPLLFGTLATIATIVVSHPTLQIVVTELVAGNAAMLGLVAIPLAWQGWRSQVPA